MKGTAIAAISILMAGAPTMASVITFESVTLPAEGYLNDAGGQFIIDQVTFINNYDADSNYWSGFAISNRTDVTTPGFTNEFSAITGGGFGGSSNYAVGYYATNEITTHVDLGVMTDLTGLGAYFTNTTYAVLDMQNGSGFSKKFGGPTGNDPDWFKLTIQGFAGLASTGTVEFYLADFRNEGGKPDYIVNNWRYVNFTPLGSPDRLEMSLSSSDSGLFGINTPSYFAMDHFLAIPEPSSSLCIAITGLGLLLRRKR
jgi:Domain of unknown function (DUF4465)